jgi:hypothetical protein
MFRYSHFLPLSCFPPSSRAPGDPSPETDTATTGGMPLLLWKKRFRMIGPPGVIVALQGIPKDPVGRRAPSALELEPGEPPQLIL